MADPEFATYWEKFRERHKKRKQHHVPDVGEDERIIVAKAAGEMVVEEAEKPAENRLLCNVGFVCNHQIYRELITLLNKHCYIHSYIISFMDSAPTPAAALLNSLIPDQRLVRCTAGDITFVIAVVSNITFDDLCKGIILNNHSISLDQSSLWYSFKNQMQCIIRNDQDVYLMFQCQRMLLCEFVDLEIKRSVLTNVVIDGMQSPKSMNYSNNGPYLAEIENQIRPTKTYLTELWRQYIHSEEQVFKCAKEFKEDLIKYSILLGFSFDYVYNDKDRVTAKCSRKEEDGCERRVQASKNRANGLFYIQKLNNIHTCSGRYRTRKNKKLNSSLVASLVMDKIRDNPRLRPKDIVSDFKGSYGLDISYWNAWFGKEVARIEVQGSNEGSYAILARYVEAINETNLGSRCVLEFDNETRRFWRYVVCCIWVVYRGIRKVQATTCP
ncbi:hypothetical protein LguiA_020034 [Lonicera macranthoides]